MSATEEVRALLDARGVEWMGTDYTEPTNGHATNTSLGHEHHDAVFAEYVDGTVLRLFDLTPEQAIAATLGSSNCTNSERTETCKVDVLNTGDCAGYECSEYIMHCNGCGHEFGHVLYNEDGDVWMSEPPNYCPNCGRRCVG